MGAGRGWAVEEAGLPHPPETRTAHLLPPGLAPSVLRVGGLLTGAPGLEGGWKGWLGRGDFPLQLSVVIVFALEITLYPALA